MMTVKGGTQAFIKPADSEFNKGDTTQSFGADNRQKALGGEESVGDMLNKVADPNYINDSKKMRTVGNPALSKDSFMTLLLTQMKNQDPTSPLKSHEMAAQLAQFTSLEKLNNINDSIAGLRKDQAPDHNFQALSFIGKTIQTDNSKLNHEDKDARHDVSFVIPADAPKISMVVKDAEGKTVRTVEFKNLKTGKNQLNWNGMTDDGRSAPVGEYNVAIEAEGSNGHKLQVDMKTEGTISGVNFTAHGPQLMVGKQVVSMSEVKSISDGKFMDAMNANAQAPDAAARSMQIPGANIATPVQGPKKVEMKKETKDNAAKAAILSKGTLNDTPMAQGLINKLNKTGAKVGMEG
jgi:flagellar basal-body rod modification protein FlgD